MISSWKSGRSNTEIELMSDSADPENGVRIELKGDYVAVVKVTELFRSGGGK